MCRGRKGSRGDRGAIGPEEGRGGPSGGYSFANWLTAAETYTRGWTGGVTPQRLPAPAAATAHAITRLPCDRPRR
jgi:hypothetical protein